MSDAGAKATDPRAKASDAGGKITDAEAIVPDAGARITDAGTTRTNTGATTTDEAKIPDHGTTVTEAAASNTAGIKMTDAEILTLVDRLERCLLGKAEFHHRDHLAVATVYLCAADFDSALDRMRATLLRFAAHHGVPNLYHETLTRFWISEISRRLDRSLCLRESVARIQAALGDKDLPFIYYRKETLNSPEAKAGFVEPDLTKCGI